MLKIDPVPTKAMPLLTEMEPYGSSPRLEPKETVFPTVLLGTSADLMVGERVVAIGSPHGQTHSVSTGIISGEHRNVAVPSRGLNFRDLIQTDASINLGNSGGPLLNIHGELIGINTVMNSAAENIGFAIPVDRVRQVLEDELFPNARKAWLGFEVEARVEGLIVSRVWEEGPAAASGLCPGDRIVSLGDAQVDSLESYDFQRLNVLPGDETRIGVLRGSDIEETRVRSWDEMNGYFYREIGMTLSEQSLGRNKTFLMVQKIRPGSQAHDLGVETGDLIPAIRPNMKYGRAFVLRDKASFKTLLKRIPPGTEIDVDAYRDMNNNRSYELNEQLKGVLIR